jgi:hypothetical protein
MPRAAAARGGCAPHQGGSLWKTLRFHCAKFSIARKIARRPAYLSSEAASCATPAPTGALHRLARAIALPPALCGSGTARLLTGGVDILLDNTIVMF